MSSPFELDGIPGSDLNDDDLERELAHLHETRHDVFLHGSAQALSHHTQRLVDLEREFLRRHPQRDIDPDRLRSGARARSDEAARH